MCHISLEKKGHPTSQKILKQDTSPAEILWRWSFPSKGIVLFLRGELFNFAGSILWSNMAFKVATKKQWPSGSFLQNLWMGDPSHYCIYCTYTYNICYIYMYSTMYIYTIHILHIHIIYIILIYYVYIMYMSYVYILCLYYNIYILYHMYILYVCKCNVHIISYVYFVCVYKHTYIYIHIISHEYVVYLYIYT